ncbi:MAG: DNA polymerase/3'-5' exonuclease PolX [Nanoarchaeota archaeon]
MKNLEIAKILHGIADILELQEVPWKPQAYRKAALAIETLSEDIEEIYKRSELEEIPGVGEHIARKIEEIIKTGKLKYYEELKKKVPLKLDELMSVPGLGPKKIKLLYQKLKVKSIKDLEEAAKKQKIRKIKTLGAVTEENILRGIELAKGAKRFPLGRIMPLAEEIKQKLLSQPFIKRVEIAGSYRRKKETVGDIDILSISDKPAETMDFFTKMPGVKSILAKGTTKSIIVLNNNLQVDIRVLPEKEFGSALQYFTGDKEHNIAVRKIALKKGYTLSEYGLFELKTKKWLAGRSEEEIYQKLGMQMPPPEIRTNSGEVEAALAHKLPKLVEYKEVHADFHIHSDFSDGDNSLEEMIAAAKKLGHQSIAVTDHMGPLKIAHALDEKRLQKYVQEIERVGRKVPEINVLIGAEVDIDKNGNLTATKKMLSRLDFVLAAVHSSFKMPEKEMTARIIHAFENYSVNALAHPSGRLINQRESYLFDQEKVFQAAKDKNIFLEINAFPDRLDLNGELIRKALQFGCKFTIGTDSHNREQLKFIELGTATARCGWLEKKDLLNCWDAKKIGKALER